MSVRFAAFFFPFLRRVLDLRFFATGVSVRYTLAVQARCECKRGKLKSVPTQCDSRGVLDSNRASVIALRAEASARSSSRLTVPPLARLS